MRTALTSVIVLCWALGSGGTATAQDSCIDCHAALEGTLADAVKDFESDVHSQAGLGCAGCHGGDPGDQSMDSMSPAKGFRGTPGKTQVPNSALPATPTLSLCIASILRHGLTS